MFRLFHKGQLINIHPIYLVNISGTIVHSDQWPVYWQISNMCYGLKAIDHKLDFVKPITVTHTQQCY